MIAKKLTASLALLVPAALLQGSCQTTDWQAWHYPYAGETADADASLIEYDVTVHPPNPPITWDYTVTVTEIVLETKSMDTQYVEPYPGYQTYIGHDVKFGPHLPDRSALTYARYQHASEIRMVSDGLPPSTDPYVTTDDNKPTSWDSCYP